MYDELMEAQVTAARIGFGQMTPVCLEAVRKNVEAACRTLQPRDQTARPPRVLRSSMYLRYCRRPGRQPCTQARDSACRRSLKTGPVCSLKIGHPTTIGWVITVQGWA